MGLAVVGALVGLALVALFALPHVVDVSPAAGAQNASPRARVRIVFDQPMNTASVEAALQIQPPHAGTFAWDEAQRTLTFIPREPWPLLGTVTVQLSGGRSQLGLPLTEPRTWSFTVGRERLAFLSGSPPNLAVISIAQDDTPQALTSEPHGIHEFAVHPGGDQIIYAARRADGGADLKAINLGDGIIQEVLPCPDAACRAPAFSPDGSRLAYEHQSPVSDPNGNTVFGEPRVHVLSLSNGEDIALGDPANQTRTPQWGPDGRVSFYDAARQAIVVQDPVTGAVTFIPSDSGEVGTWSPDGRYIVFSEIVLDNSLAITETASLTQTVAYYSHLQRVEIATNATLDLSGPGVVEDASPVYSFSGEWVAFTRRGLSAELWTPGREIWLMRADGSEARPLTNEPFYTHSALAWSPDDQWLAYMRLDATDLAATPEIWIIGADGSGARRLVTGGYSPEWLP